MKEVYFHKLTILFALLTIFGCSDSYDRSEKIANGIVKVRYNNGEEMDVIRYPNPLDSSKTKFYYFHENGQLGAIGNLELGILKDSIWVWYDSLGNLDAIANHDSGILRDFLICFDESGNVYRRLVEIDRENQTWLANDYFPNHQKKYEMYLIGDDQIVDGSFTEWDSSGLIIEQGMVDSTQKTGIWKMRNENNILVDTLIGGSVTFNE